MDRDIAELVRSYNGPEELARELVLLFARQQLEASSLATIVDDFEPLDVDRTFLDEEDEESDDRWRDPGTTENTLEAPRIGGRYVDLGPISAGGMGEVRRVRDTQLNRTLAMKILHSKMLRVRGAIGRFLEEAQATAQLQHPNIVPVHDLGIFPDGRLWFTMKEVRGRTLSEVARDVHQASDWRWNAAPTGWTFRRVVASFLGLCQAMAYAHERGVIHRDLKPENVMVGRHGEVYVLDWGLAKMIDGAQPHAPDHPDPGAKQPAVSPATRAEETRYGTVAGTPSYMAPEQAQGEIDRIDARTDVYALGGILYQILSGRSPYRGPSGKHVLDQVLAGPPLPVDQPATPTAASAQPRPPIPEELIAACTRAMAREPDDRYPSALDLAREIEDWLDGSRKRDQALEITERGLRGVTEAARLLREAADRQGEGDALLESLETWRPEEDKAPGWALQDEAAALRRQAELAKLAVDQGLHGALRVAPDLAEAHAALAERYRERHAAAEAARDGHEMARTETLVRMHTQALPEANQTRRRCAVYLRGDGALSLVTDPPGARVVLHRYELRNRRLVEVPFRSLGPTPIREVSLPRGSYLALISHPDCDPVRYPLDVPRLGHWHGIAPGESEPTAVWLPPAGTLGPDEIYVPAGWFIAGGDPKAPNSHPARRLWCHPVVVQRTPVTNRAYLRFLGELVAAGRTEEALRHAPRERAGVAEERGALIYDFDGERFSLVADADGDLWDPDWPVFQVDWHGARAFLAWQAERTGRGWRLPGELEWEKAGRGVDGRWYPWGDHLDPSWCCMADSHRTHPLPAAVDRFPVDRGPSGVSGLGGNTSDWCLDLFARELEGDGERVALPLEAPEAPPRAHRVIRGGSWYGSARSARTAYRDKHEPTNQTSNVGFRGAWTP